MFAFVAMALVALAGFASTARALTLGEDFFQAGIGFGRINGATRNANMITYTALYNQNLHDGLVAFDARGSYQYGRVSSGGGGTVRDGDVDFLLSIPKIPIVKPFAIAGVSLDRFSLRNNFGPEHGWDLGYNLGIGAEVHVLPMLPVTASIRYTHGDRIERVTYMLDGTFWISKIGVGANIVHENGRGGFENNIPEGNLYFALRF
jgi:opacity protein-like surface antigen